MNTRLVLAAALLVATSVIAQDSATTDADLQPPALLSLGPYVGSNGDDDSDGFVLIRFLPVPDASLYRIYREILVDYGPDPSGGLIALDEPEAVWVPWGSIDAIPGQDVVQVVIATLDGVDARFGVATEVVEEGQRRVSEMAVFPLVDPPTADSVTGWAQVKQSR